MRLSDLGWILVGLVTLGLVVMPLRAQTPSAGGALLSNSVVRLAGVWANNKLLWNATAPTVSSGFGTTPTIASQNGNATFRVNVGTGGTASTGVLTMPQAANGWNCVISDTSAPAGKAALTKVTSSSTTSVSVTAYRDDGAAFAWNTGTELVFVCAAY